MILFTVEDNGTGINPEKADKLFQKFYQIDIGPTRKHAGTGRGLVICKGIIEAHGGRIWVDKAPKTGATIKFTLPVINRNNIQYLCSSCYPTIGKCSELQQKKVSSNCLY